VRVVVDHGFWTPEDRAKWRAVATDAGATPVLVYLAASHDDDPHAIYFSESDLQRYRTRFIPPQEDEPHLLYQGDAADVIAAMEATRP
jgi:hypothetical protein